MPSRVCILRGPGCSDGGIAVSGTSRCPDHSKGWTKSPEMQARSHFYDSRAWRERRARQLEAEPNCRQCGAPATIADHIHNIGSGGDPDGPLQSLCLKCHNRKTASEGGKAAKANRRGGQS